MTVKILALLLLSVAVAHVARAEGETTTEIPSIPEEVTTPIDDSNIVWVDLEAEEDEEETTDKENKTETTRKTRRVQYPGRVRCRLGAGSFVSECGFGKECMPGRSAGGVIVGVCVPKGPYDSADFLDSDASPFQRGHVGEVMNSEIQHMTALLFAFASVDDFDDLPMHRSQWDDVDSDSDQYTLASFLFAFSNIDDDVSDFSLPIQPMGRAIIRPHHYPVRHHDYDMPPYHHQQPYRPIGSHDYMLPVPSMETDETLAMLMLVLSEEHAAGTAPDPMIHSHSGPYRPTSYYRTRPVRPYPSQFRPQYPGYQHRFRPTHRFRPGTSQFGRMGYGGYQAPVAPPPPQYSAPMAPPPPPPAPQYSAPVAPPPPVAYSPPVAPPPPPPATYGGY